LDTGPGDGGAVRLDFCPRRCDHSSLDGAAGAVARVSLRSRAARLPGGGGSGMVSGAQWGVGGQVSEAKKPPVEAGGWCAKGTQKKGSKSAHG